MKLENYVIQNAHSLTRKSIPQMPNLTPKESKFFSKHKKEVVMSDRGRKIKEPIYLDFD